MRAKIYIYLSFIIIALFFLAACQPPVAITEVDCVKSEVLCVGLITGLDGIDDKSYNQLAWEGVQQAHTEKTADWVRYIETVDLKDYYQNIASLAEAGYDIIVTVGSQNAEATSIAASDYPEILFVGVDQVQSEVRLNLASLVFHDDKTGFLAGALAAQMTKTGTIAGIFGPDSMPSTVAFKEGYEAGAKYINPNIHVISTFQPIDPNAPHIDAEWGSTTASEAISNGADVVFGVGDKVGNGALFEAANHRGVYCIGGDYDQWETFPEAHPCLLSSAIGQVSQGVMDILKLAKEEKFPSGNFFGASGLAPYHDNDGVTSKAIKDNIASIIADLNSGVITTGVSTP